MGVRFVAPIAALLGKSDGKHLVSLWSSTELLGGVGGVMRLS